MCVLTLTIEVTAALKEVRLTTRPIPSDTLVIGMTSDTSDTGDTDSTKIKSCRHRNWSSILTISSSKHYFVENYVFLALLKYTLALFLACANFYHPSESNLEVQKMPPRKQGGVKRPGGGIKDFLS